MPTTIRTASKVSHTPAKSSAGTYVRFSDKLTGSINDISKIIDQHKGMIDSIQEVALELTASIASLHALTVKYARTANNILDALLPILKSLPIVPRNVMQLLTNLEAATQKIIDNEKSTARTIMDVQAGLRTGDVNKIRGHDGRLQAVTKSLTAILPR
jgi:hypothetical protein